MLLIDNYDSFTSNLVQALASLGARCQVRLHDAIDIDGIEALAPDGLLLGPGPCTPDDAGITLRAIEAFAGKIPILGVCLGHQAIGQHFGGKVVRAIRPLHGKTSPILHDGTGPFAKLPSPFDATRYNSLVVDPASVPSCLRVAAWTGEGEVMALAHHELAIWGVQFHPESILTPLGPKLLSGWLASLPSGNTSCEQH